MKAVAGNFLNNMITDAIENRYSHWGRRIRIFASVLRFSHKCLNKIRGVDSLSLDNVELRIKAEQTLIRELQKKYYCQEYRLLLRAKIDYMDQNRVVPESFRIRLDLDLFMDENLLLRCRGRLQDVNFDWDTIHPILMPKKSEAVRSYVRHLHINSHHIGLSHMIAKIREKYWIPKYRTLIKSVLHRCVGCRRWTGGSFSLPKMPPLPLERVEQASPFLNIGIDFTGPVNIKTGNSVQKVYVVIYACLVTRAIHLEIARDTTAAEFLRTFIRFSSIQECSKFMITDNALNFVFIQMVLDKVNITDRGILNYCSVNEMRWKFIPQYSTW